MRGAEPTVICKSEPPQSTMRFSNSVNVGSAILVLPRLRILVLLTPGFSLSEHRLPHDFLHARHAGERLGEPAAAQRNHALLHRLAPQFQRRRAGQNQLSNLIRDLHHLVKAHAAPVTSIVARRAALALE